jgi:tetratricopeptide (TPR) repeat protein
LRTVPRATVLGLCGVLLVAVQAILGFLEAASWVRVIAAVLIAGVAVGSELDKLHTRNAESAEVGRLRIQEAAEAEERWLRGVREWMMWPAPLISDVDPYTIGVARPQHRPLREVPAGELGPYVPRDIDRNAREQLRGEGLLLLIGTPASGVTRTAYETVKAEGIPRLVLAPRPPQGMKRALDDLDVLSRLKPSDRLVLWLDRLDRFPADGLTAQMLRQCMQRSPTLRVVATVSSTRYPAWVSEASELSTEFGGPITLERLPSSGELDRAERLYPGLDFSEGIAAAFTAVGSLLVRLRGGDFDCPFEPAGSDCPLARAIIDMSISWAGTGSPRPLTQRQLTALVQQRLRLGDQPDPDHTAHCLDWATAPVREGVAPLSCGVSNDGTPTVSAHRDVAEIRNAEGQTVDRAVWIAALTDAEEANDSEAVGRIGYQAHIQDSLDIAADAWIRTTALDEPAVEWLEQAASFSHGQHRPAAEIPPRQRLLELTETAHGADHPEVAAVLHKLGNAWFELGQPAKARELYERALLIKEREYGPDNPEVASTLNNLGNTWLDLGRPAMARDLYERALPIDEREYGPDYPEVASTLGNLGNAWHDLGQPAKARELYERALRIMEQEYGPDHPDVATVLSNLGIVWHELGQPAKARELHERALLIKEREYGPDHPNVARILNNLGMAWRDLGQPDKARELHERALRIKEREYGPDHPEVASTLSNVGNAWRDLGQPDKARELHERALRIKEREYGPDHPKLASTLSNLGNAWRDLGQPAKARELHERALLIDEREYGPDHPKVASTLSNLGNVWHDLGQPDKARELQERAIRILVTAFPTGHHHIDQITDNLRTVAPDVIVLSDGRIIDPPAEDHHYQRGASQHE